MRIISLFIILLVLFSSACARHVVTQEEKLNDLGKDTIVFFENGNKLQTAKKIDEMLLILPTGSYKVNEIFTNNINIKDYYLEYIINETEKISNINEALSIYARIESLKMIDLGSNEKLSKAVSNLNKSVYEGNINGKLQYIIGDKSIDIFPLLKSSPHIEIIIDRSIKICQDNSSKTRPISHIVDFVNKKGLDSNEWKKLNSLLPTMNIKQDELEIVAKTFPKFATNRKNEITATVLLEVKNGDRLFSEDLLTALRSNIRGVEWVTSLTPKTTTLVVERVRNDEKTIQERSETIAYAQHQVNLAAAVLLMPQNASYLYDVISGGSEIEYGYVITATNGGKTIYDELIRGKIGGEYRRCQNARIQNVFGGVSPAGFVANDDMKRRCSGPTSLSMDQLRKEIFTKLSESVLKIPTVKTAQSYL